jgi:hypothetical protein
MVSAEILDGCMYRLSLVQIEASLVIIRRETTYSLVAKLAIALIPIDDSALLIPLQLP